MKCNYLWKTQSSTYYIGLVTLSKPSGYTQNSVIINSLENKVKKVDFENLLSEECKNFI